MVVKDMTKTVELDQTYRQEIREERKIAYYADQKSYAEIAAEKSVFYRFWKRFFDITLSAAALIILSPVFFITAIAIWLEDGAPVFYAQTRIGKNETPFQCYKFRSMRKNAAEIHEQLRKEYGATDVSFKLKNDPRVTKVGGFIRKYNIDELPQLFNILKGEMSFVGPRPLPDYEYQEEKKRYGDTYAARYFVPQGLTCIWQISNRAETDFTERMRMDIRYVKERNPYLDAKLFVLTAVYAVTGKAAIGGFSLWRSRLYRVAY